MNFKKPSWEKIYFSLINFACLFMMVLVVFGFYKLNSSPSKDNVAETSPQQSTPTETTPEQEEQPPLEPSKTLTAVSIATTSDDPAAQTAVNDLTSYLTKKGVTVAADANFPITLSIDSTLGEDSFRIQATVGEGKNECLTITGGNGRGLLYGVYQFLEKYADVRFFTPELEICEVGDVTFGDGLLVDYTPTLTLRQTDWYRWKEEDVRANWATKNGINIISGWNYSWGEELGGSLTYAPDMFVHTIGKLAELDTPYPATAPNPCLTDENVYNTVLKNVLEVLRKNPDAKILSVSQNDNEKHCNCENCTAIEAEEGSASGPLIRFVNRIAGAIAEEFPNVTIDTLAYKYTQKPPKVTKPAANVCIRLSTITCHCTHPITKSGCSSCSNFRKALEDWSAICENIYIWDYTTNYSYYLATFPNFHVLRENMKFFAEHNVKGVFEQGNASGPSGEFGELRAYLIGKILMNPYMTSEEYYAHMDEFLAAYYGEGWQNIRNYINTFTQYAKTSTGGMTLYNYPFGVLSKDSLASLEGKFNEWWDAAEAAAGDRLEYVQRSRWQLRYLLLYIHPDLETATAFAKEVEAAGTKWSERDPKLLWYAYEYELLALAPDKWFTPPQK